MCMHSRHDQYWQIAYPMFFVAQKYLKKDLEIDFFFLRKLSRFWGQFSSTKLAMDTFYVKYYSRVIEKVLENWPQIRDNFLK